MNKTQRTIADIIASARLRRGLTDRDEAGDLYPTVEVEIDYIGCYGDLAQPVRQKIERDIARQLNLTDWTAEGGQATETGEVWTYRRPAHRPRLDPVATRVVRSYRLNPKTIAAIDIEAKRTGESAGQVVDRLALSLGTIAMRDCPRCSCGGESRAAERVPAFVCQSCGALFWPRVDSISRDETSTTTRLNDGSFEKVYKDGMMVKGHGSDDE